MTPARLALAFASAFASRRSRASRPAARASSARLLAACGAVALLSAPACGGDRTPASAAKSPSPFRPETFDHERCDDRGPNVLTVDTNGDGKPDIRRVFDAKPDDKGARELCRVVDLNHDGRPDLYEYFDASGAIRRREFCYDDTGVVNAIETYQGGKLVERVYDTTGQHKIDTWDWFDPNAQIDAKTGRPTHPSRRERDINGFGLINQWWTWNGDTVSIATDRNGDGKPDPESVIVLGDDAGAAGAAPASSPSVGAGDAQAPAPLASSGQPSAPGAAGSASGADAGAAPAGAKP